MLADGEAKEVAVAMAGCDVLGAQHGCGEVDAERGVTGSAKLDAGRSSEGALGGGGLTLQHSIEVVVWRSVGRGCHALGKGAAAQAHPHGEGDRRRTV